MSAAKSRRIRGAPEALTLRDPFRRYVESGGGDGLAATGGVRGGSWGGIWDEVSLFRNRSART